MLALCLALSLGFNPRGGLGGTRPLKTRSYKTSGFTTCSHSHTLVAVKCCNLDVQPHLINPSVTHFINKRFGLVALCVWQHLDAMIGSPRLKWRLPEPRC